MADRLSEADEVTLRVLAIIDGTTVAEQRRQAVRAYARLARQDDGVAQIVRLILASRRCRARNSRAIGGANVIRIGDRSG